MGKTAKNGDLVTVNYDGTLDNGEIFESTSDGAPLEFRIGDQSVLPAFEQAVVGMRVGETATITIQPEEAYGLRHEELTHMVKRQALGMVTDPRPGMLISLTINKDEVEHKVPAMVTAVRGEEVDVDFNHPLAGKSLTYKITLAAIS